MDHLFVVGLFGGYKVLKFSILITLLDMLTYNWGGEDVRAYRID